MATHPFSLLFLSSFLFLSDHISAVRAAPADQISAVRSACAATPHPDLCHASFSRNPSLLTSATAPKDVIHGAVILSIAAVNHAALSLHRTAATWQSNLTQRELTALGDCDDMLHVTLDELRAADVALGHYSGAASSAALARHAADLRTLLSAAVTNEGACLDGFSHDATDKLLREQVKEDVLSVSHHCSNVLAMVTGMAEQDMKEKLAAEGKEREGRRKLLDAFEVDDAGFPDWMTAGDRRLLQGAVAADVVVAADGSGNFRKISEAVAAAPSNSGKRYVIRIKAGTYTENVEVPKGKKNLMFVGDGIGATVISGSRNVVDGSTTFRSATVAIVGGGFLARDLTIENTAGPSKHQAVALRVGSDLAAFYRCEFRAYQDTLYVHSLRQFFRDCTISGTVDFIFGNSAVVIQNSNIIARRPNPNQRNMVTAQGREDPNQNTGIVIQRCTIGGASDLPSSTRTFLGRPWKEYSRTVVMQSTISSVIDPAGWFEWSGNFALNTLTYREYQNTGAGAGTANRVTWKGFKVITTASEAVEYTVENFVAGASWLRGTGFPFSLGL
ncbi:pectinesterase-like [Wolffia australiana]